MTEIEAEVKVWRREEKNQRTKDLSLHIRTEQGLIESQIVTDSLKIVKTRKNEMKGNKKEHLRKQKKSRKELIRGKDLGMRKE